MFILKFEPELIKLKLCTQEKYEQEKRPLKIDSNETTDLINLISIRSKHGIDKHCKSENLN